MPNDHSLVEVPDRTGMQGLLKHWVVLALTIAGLLAGFLVIHTIHFLYFPVYVVLYAVLLDAVITLGLTIVAFLLVHRRFLAITGTEKGLCCIIGFLAMIIYGISIPTIIDRSLSIYFLEKLVQRGDAIRLDAWDAILKNEFMREHRIVDIRLTEQLHSGTVIIENDCVRLTPRGAFIAQVSRFYRTTLLPKKREIMNQMTDDLTDPFRNTPAQATPYKCD